MKTERTQTFEGIDLLRSALRVHRELVADDLLVDARLQVFLEAIGQSNEHVVDRTLVLHELLQKRSGFATIVLAQKIPHGLERNFALKVEVDVVEQVLDQFLHARSPSRVEPPAGRGLLMASRYTRRKKDCARNMWVCLAHQDRGVGELLSLAGPDRRVVRLVAHEAGARVAREGCATFVAKTKRMRIDAMSS